ncbi:MAG: hypothetical protein A3E25_21380 [Burkholderiales bacterium RIFCSPHIGHO2_12_FULL_69_20]|nr:MAG: hypothetical protein A3E25_21380 [Burkholderiales bacterium RIFCSPHIGHO2_12_FULL_69_20]
MPHVVCLRPWALLGLALICTLAALQPAAAQPLQGTRQLLLHQRDGSAVALGTVVFTPQADGRSAFALQLRREAFKDFFLSMKEFKCVESAAEVFCHVPYPYPQPGTVSATDLAWLEHALLFMFKTPSEFGAKLWNGVYFQLRATERGFEGRPQAVDLNRISAPPDKPGVPPFRPALRDDIAPGARFFNRLTIE